MPELEKLPPRSRANATPEKKIVTQQEWDPDTEKRAKEGEG
jgi:hypothetical protein